MEAFYDKFIHAFSFAFTCVFLRYLMFCIKLRQLRFSKIATSGLLWPRMLQINIFTNGLAELCGGARHVLSCTNNIVGKNFD